MRVLGLDPGTARLGWGVIEGEEEPRLVGCGTLTTPANLPLATRLAQLFSELQTIVTQFRPEAAALEEIFFSRNARTAFAVGQARGAALVALAVAGIPVHEYTPLEVKQAVTGYGRAQKHQVQEMVRALLRLAEPPRPDDTADALAVAICHFHAARMQRLLAERTE